MQATAADQPKPLLQLGCVTKDYGEGLVLGGIDLGVYEGEFLTLLGPSGCGKSTTLRVIAGLEAPTSGRVYLDGVDITDFPPEKRDVNTVFQNYALFPHMNVYKNIAYGLKLRHASKNEIAQRVEEMLRMVQLQGYEKRMPSQLSGGQRQRVAIARALALRPRLLLLDEPLGSLDLQLRQQMQVELKRLQQELGITFIYVTHDQEEALNMSSRIAIMRGGRIEQIGTPEQVYERPESLFCARFIGQATLLRGAVSHIQASGECVLNAEGLALPAMADPAQLPEEGDRMALCLRPQRVHYGAEPSMGMSLEGVLQSKEYAGGTQRTRIELAPGVTVGAISQTAELDAYPVGSKLYVWWDIRHAPLVPDDDDLPPLKEAR